MRDLILGGSPRLLDDSVARWNRFVVELDDWGYDEYANFLFTRDALNAAETAVSPDAAVVMRDRYAAIDRHYRQLTRPIDFALHDGPARWSPRGWWFYRVPHTIDDDFARSAGVHPLTASEEQRQGATYGRQLGRDPAQEGR